MKMPPLACLAIAAVFTLALGVPTNASLAAEQASATASKRMPVYRPPLRGAPASRVGGGTRGADETMPVLEVLVPEHTGFTTQAQPTLYWYISQPTTLPIELTLTGVEAVQPLLELTLEPPESGGIQALDLSNYRVSLKPDVEYRWYVALVPDPEQRSYDILAGGALQRIEPDPALTQRLARVEQERLPSVYAEAGLWYDAVDALGELIAAHPNDYELRAQRAALAEQVELSAVAAYDRQSAP